MSDLKVVDAVVVGNRMFRRWSSGAVRLQNLVTGEIHDVIDAGDDPDGLVWKAILRAAHPMLRAKEDGAIVPIHESRAVMALKEIREITDHVILWAEAEIAVGKINAIAEKALSEAP